MTLKRFCDRCEMEISEYAPFYSVNIEARGTGCVNLSLYPDEDFEVCSNGCLLYMTKELVDE